MKKIMTTFFELERAGGPVDLEKVITTLEEYATSGAGINPQVVCNLISRGVATFLQNNDDADHYLIRAKGYLELGYGKQRALDQIRSSREYQRALDFVVDMLTPSM